VTSSGALLLTGLALPWGVERRDQRTRIARGAFAEVFDEAAAVPIVVNHRSDAELGAVRAGGRGLHRLWTDRHGLWFSFAISPGPVADALESAADLGRVTGCSVGPCSIDGIEVVGDRFRIVRADLREISILLSPSCPAFPGTRLTTKRMPRSEGWEVGPREQHRLLHALRTAALTA
jgi:HK97 family phage prohead protease